MVIENCIRVCISGMTKESSKIKEKYEKSYPIDQLWEEIIMIEEIIINYLSKNRNNI